MRKLLRIAWEWLRSEEGRWQMGGLLLFGLAVAFAPQGGELGYPWEGMGLVLIAVTTVLGLIVLCPRDGDGQAQGWTRMVQVLALGSGSLMLWYLRQAEYAPGGFWVDNWFSNAMILHYKVDAGNHDFTYQGLHSFYPALFHWAMARLAVIFALPAHQMLPIGAIWTAYLLPLLVFRAWRRLLDAQTAFLIAAVGIFLSTPMLPGKPYEMIGLLLIVPWYLHFQYRLAPEKRGVSRSVVFGGVLGGLLVMTYYYWFFLLAMLWLGEWGGALLTKTPRTARTNFRAGGYVLFWLLVTSLPFWAPLVYDLLSYPIASAQNRWFRPWMIGSSLFQFRPWPIYAGIAYLLFAYRTHWLPRFLLQLLVALMAWNLLGMLMMMLGLPLLHARMNLFFDLIALVGLALGAIRLQEVAIRYGQAARPWLIVGAAALLLLVTAKGLLEEQKTESWLLAHTSAPPEVVHDPELGAAVRGRVMLTNHPELNAHLPVWYFAGHNAFYAHPASQYADRIAFLAAISESTNPDFVAWMLRYNRFDAVDLLYWPDEPMVYGLDNFPNEKATRQKIVKFAPEIWRGQYFIPSASGKWFRVTDPPKELWTGFSTEELRLVEQYGGAGSETNR